MRRFIYAFRLFPILILFFTMANCGGGSGGSSSNQSGTTAVTVSLDNKSDAKSVFGKIISKSASAIPSNVAFVKILISAVDMPTIERVVDVAGETEVRETFQVPTGINRHFLVAAVSSDGAGLYQGESTADLDGTPRDITIQMAFDISGDWTVTHDGPHSDFITYTQTGNSLTLSGDFVGSGTIQGNAIEVSFTALRDCAEVDATGTVSPDGNSASGTLTATGTTAGGCQFIEGTFIGTWTAVRGHVTPPSQGTIAGTVKDALTGSPLSDVTVRLSQQGSTVATVTNNTDGTYSLTAAAGSGYSVEFSKPGFITVTVDNVTVNANTTTTVDAVLTEILSQGQTRIVLTWGATPDDLDSHLTGPIPDSGSRFHVFWADDCFPQDSCTIDNNENTIPGPNTFSVLDHDDTESFGPETTTIVQQFGGIYRFSVHDFSNRLSTNSIALSNSGAQVKVFRGSSVIATFDVPANQEGTLWTVFELNGDTITPVNTMSFQSEETAIQSVSRQSAAGKGAKKKNSVIKR